VEQNTFVANSPYVYGHILNLVRSSHVWYQENHIIGEYASKWHEAKADRLSFDIHQS
jgi:hypothetical protein